jgi:phage shock protein A
MVTDIGGSGETLNRLETIVNEERYKAAGKVRVAVDSLDMHDVHIKEAEQSALAEQALAQFEAKEASTQIGSGSTETVPAIIKTVDERNPS